MTVTQHEHEVVLEAQDSTVRIALTGATVYSWQSAGQERFFQSRKSPIEGPSALRGGVPVVWPVFGPPPKEAPYDKLKQHGFARSTKWTYAGETSQNGVKFTLRPTDKIKEVYEPDFALEYHVEVLSSTSLRTSLHVENPSTSTLRFQALLHNYFLLAPGTTLKDVSVGPLAGLTYKDKVQGGKEVKEEAENATIQNTTDRVYAGAFKSSDSLHLKYGRKGLRLMTQNLPDAVFWNPDQQKSDAIGDMEPAGFERFVCVEPGHVAGWIELGSKDKWTGSQTLTVDL